MWLYIYLDVQLEPAGPRTCSIDQSIEGATTSRASSLTPDMNWVVSFLQVPPPKKKKKKKKKKHFHTFNRCQNLIATVLHTPQTLSKINEPPAKGVKINLHSSSSLIHKCQNYFPYYIYHPLQVFSSSLLMKTSCLRLKLVEFKLLSKFSILIIRVKTDVANAINVITYKICMGKIDVDTSIKTQVLIQSSYKNGLHLNFCSVYSFFIFIFIFIFI